MAQLTETSTHLIDTAIGPLSVTDSTYLRFDIDDFVHSTVRAQAIKLRVIFSTAQANPKLAKDRPPVDIEGVTVGGF
jgi:hypothetical protein